MWLPQSRIDLGQTALAAFRADLAASPAGAAAADPFILIATLARQAAAEPDSPASARHLEMARSLAFEACSKARASGVPELDLPGQESPLDVLRAVQVVIYSHGWLSLSRHLLESLESLAPEGSITAGRIQYDLTRESGNTSAYERAEAELSILEHSEYYRIPELRYRHFIHRAHLERSRGNLGNSVRLLEEPLPDVGAA